MKVLIIGASRGTGACCVDEALKRGHQVTAFSRSAPSRTEPGLQVRRGDYFEQSEVDAVVPGHDAVVITAATHLSTFAEVPDYFSRGTRVVIDSMKRHGVKRLAVLSALGVGDSRAVMNFMMRMMVVNGILKAPFSDHERREELTRTSGLDWVIARPTRMTHGPATQPYACTSSLTAVPATISRANVAHFLLEACERPDLVGHAFHLGG